MRIAVFGGIGAFVVGIVVLVAFLPAVAAVAFILLAALVALLVATKKGRVKAFVAFLKDAVFGW